MDKERKTKKKMKITKESMIKRRKMKGEKGIKKNSYLGGLLSNLYDHFIIEKILRGDSTNLHDYSTNKNKSPFKIQSRPLPFLDTFVSAQQHFTRISRERD